jgi:hypothetical protein
MLTRLFPAALAALALCAQAAAPRPPALMETIGAESPVRLSSLKTQVDIAGSYAETTLEMTFSNPNNRPLEGNVQLPLLPNQQAVGFALDFNGKLRQAVPVEKAKGREVFEAVERRRVDPGLLEATQGNMFRLRVYPIPAHGTRTVQVNISEALARDAQGYHYRLPLDVFQHIDAFSLGLNLQSAAKPTVAGVLGSLTLTPIDGGYTAKLERSDFAASGQLELGWAAQDKPQVYTRSFDGERFFVAEVPVPAETAPRVLPHVVGLLWDSSGSGANRQIGAELALLDRYFKAMGNGEVRLTRLRDVAEPVQRFKIENGKWDSLREALQHTVYDGATALDGWAPQRDVGEYLLFSDGLVNYGKGGFPTLAQGQSLYTINSASTADSVRLGALAATNGGRLIALLNADAIDGAAAMLLQSAPKLVGLSATSADQLVAASPFAEGGMLRVAGILRTRHDELHVKVAIQGGERDIVVPLNADGPEHDMAARLWAQYRVNMLEANHAANKGEIRRIGLRFGVVTGESSLIVLDTVQDYLRYDIAPPADLRTEFDRLKQQQAVTTRQAKRNHLETVVNWFKDKAAWWDKDWPKKPHREAADKPALAVATNAPVARMAAPAAAPVFMPPVEAMQVAPPPPPHAAVAPAVESAAPVMAMPAPRPMPLRARDGHMQREGNVAAKSVAATDEEAYAGNGGNTPAASLGIALKPWRADAPYLSRLREAPADKVYALYLDEKPSYTNSSAFYLDVADVLFDKGQRAMGLRVLSNLAEMDLENRHVLRILGYRLMQAGAPELAVPIFEQVRDMAGEEPQSYRDLALAYQAVKRYQDAADQLSEVVTREWDTRFPQIELIALAELNALAATAPKPLNLDRIDPRLRRNLPLDLRVVLTWDADNSDMDLWVTDPNGEKCFYGHQLTYQGGRISADFTQGYGPEEFSLRHAIPGKYRVETNFFGNTQQVVAGATTVQVKLITGFGTKDAKEQNVTLRLKDRSDTVFVGEFEVGR